MADTWNTDDMIFKEAVRPTKNIKVGYIERILILHVCSYLCACTSICGRCEVIYSHVSGVHDVPGTTNPTVDILTTAS